MSKQQSLETQATLDSPTLSNWEFEDTLPKPDKKSVKRALIEVVSDSIYKFRRRQFQDLLFEEKIQEEDIDSYRKEHLNTKTIRAEINQFLSRFDVIDFDINCYVYCLMLYKKTMQRRKKGAKNDSFIFVLKTCFFIALKYILDDTLVMLKDYSEHADIDPAVLEWLEITLLSDVLKFEVNFSQEEYQTELRNIALPIC
jgi:hypothetical protein